ncbi:Protein CBG25175 [Caenorhabditis briggsae]|uniref:Protein CBG25175 n=1 Tax=Caenorhabditis briggsae TaxID=6238 RepID=B6IFZ5_CAEBR|nr:Protein CBG25175 [Caenorhabditis briggsae]CAR98825.1 Protein CBG25175 [Caenorhabditis briggsae]
MADNLSEKLAEVAIVAETRLDDPIYQNIEIRDPVEDDDDDVTPTNSVPYQNCHINFLKCQLLPYLLIFAVTIFKVAIPRSPKTELLIFEFSDPRLQILKSSDDVRAKTCDIFRILQFFVIRRRFRQKDSYEMDSFLLELFD